MMKPTIFRRPLHAWIMILVVLASGMVQSAMGPERSDVKDFGKLAYSSADDAQQGIAVRPAGASKEVKASSDFHFYFSSLGASLVSFRSGTSCHVDFSFFKPRHSNAVFLLLRVIRR